jgi:hypothetical protein
MEDVTNHINNIGKSTKDKVFCVSLRYDELIALRALAQNPHPEYQRDPEVFAKFEEVFNDLKRITRSIEDRAIRENARPDEGPLFL